MIRIRELRQEKGWTLEYLACKLSVTNQTVSNWEKGYTQPDIQSLIRLADVFQVTVDYLVGHEKTTHDINNLKMQVSTMSVEDLRRFTIEFLENINRR